MLCSIFYVVVLPSCLIFQTEIDLFTILWFPDLKCQSSQISDSRLLMIRKKDALKILANSQVTWSRTLTFQKNRFICFNKSPLKMMENAFYFIWNALFVLKIFKFLSWLFVHIAKTGWLERSFNFKICDCHHLVKKQLQYTYCPISKEVKASRNWNLVT